MIRFTTSLLSGAVIVFTALLSLGLVTVSSEVSADTQAPFSKPFHKQGRGWYPSFYWATGRNLGSYYFPNTNGPKFRQLSDDEWDKENNALIYFYRPQSQWADEEMEAPSYYINDETVFNLRSGSYSVVELPAGSYDLAVRKSFLPLIGFESFDDKFIMAFDLNLMMDIGIELDPGDVFYFRHSEVSLPRRLHSEIEPDNPMASADVQMVDEDLALEEIYDTRYLTHSFWHSNDSEDVIALLDGEMQDYGWFSVIWPWSNNFLFGFPLFNLPSEIFRQLKPEDKRTLEQKLYALKDNPEAYLQAIQDLRNPQRDWRAPWREPKNTLSLNDELTLERLERNAREGNIEEVEFEDKAGAGEGRFNYAALKEWPFRTINDPPPEPYQMTSEAGPDRVDSALRLMKAMN